MILIDALNVLFAWTFVSFWTGDETVNQSSLERVSVPRWMDSMRNGPKSCRTGPRPMEEGRRIANDRGSSLG